MYFKEDAQYFHFIVEASNENIDLEGQTVLQKTLMASKDYFLENGVISVNHRHRQCLSGFKSDERFKGDARHIVGEPVAVYARGKSTWVRGKLYKSNPLAQIVIELLRRGSALVRASVGGTNVLISRTPDQRQRVISLKWDDLSLTVTPVNNSLQPARGIQKSVNPSIKKLKAYLLKEYNRSVYRKN
jgi:hypothetical protein